MAPFAPLLLLLAAHFFKRRLSNESLLTQASEATSVAPPWNAPTFVWKNAWRLHSWALPWLHRWDSCLAGDQNLNTAVLWWKAIAGCRRLSASYDGNIAFDLLPSWTRSIVRFPLCYLYPKLHHQNVLIRTQYLDQIVQEQLIDSSCNTDILAISLGAGFDTRSLRFLDNNALSSSSADRNNTISYFELDLPHVVKQKMSMLRRFSTRRRTDEAALPSQLPTDLNDLAMAERQLQRVFTLAAGGRGVKRVKVIFIIEAVLMYLEDENVSPLLSLCRQQAEKYLSSSYVQSGISSGSGSISLCFADRLPSRIDFTREDADVERERDECGAILAAQGWRLRSFMAKPGRARWMGVALS